MSLEISYSASERVYKSGIGHVTFISITAALFGFGDGSDEGAVLPPFRKQHWFEASGRIGDPFAVRPEVL